MSSGSPEWGHIKVAVVVAEDVFYGMTRMLDLLMDDEKDVVPFRDYEEALEWVTS